MNKLHPNVKDLTGKKYGNLTVIEFGHKGKRGMSYWKCKCKCGALTEVMVSSLNSGHTKSCGTVWCKPNFINLTGKKYGKFTVIEFSHTDKNHRSIWKCKCECGTLTEVTGSNLNSGGTKSCGCKRSGEGRVLENNQAIYNIAFRGQKQNAKKRNQTWHLDIDFYMSVVKQPCVYCNGFSKRKNKNTGTIIECNSMDRINCEPYYKEHNVQSTCFICNVAKLEMTDKEFREHIKKIYKHITGTL